ncbi:MAG: hypothetical protein ACLQUY_28565 [Ktedonobacterales bacterium]
MSTEPPDLPPAAPSTVPPSGRAVGWQFLRWLKDSPSTPGRREASAVLGGICIVFLVAMTGVPRLDTPMRVALISFVVAIPFLLEEIFWNSIKTPLIFHGSRFTVFVPRAMSAAAFWMSAVGYAAATVGFVAIVWHLWPLAVIVLIGVFVLAQLTVTALAITILVRRIFRLPRFIRSQRERARQRLLKSMLPPTRPRR